MTEQHKTNQAPFAKIVQVSATARTQLRQGASLNSVIRPVLQQLPPESRPTAQAIIYESVRKTALCRFILSKLCKNKPSQEVESLLEASLAALFLRRYTEFTIVSETVNAAKTSPITRQAAGFVNAILRRFLREKDSLLQEAKQNVEIRFNAPAWWIARIRTAYPEEANRILELGTQHPPMILRINRRKTTMEDYLLTLSANHLNAKRVGPDAVLLHSPLPVEMVPGFSQGIVSVQDAGTQLAAHLLEVTNDSRVLDACSAPGGKTAHLLERYNCQMTALEIDKHRTEKVRETLKRLNLHADVKTADASHISDWWDGKPFDYILLDAPCTASGVVRRQPDTPWLRRAGDITSLATEQHRLLTTLWPLLKNGGRMLYATCSIFPEEGTKQIERFLTETTDAELIPIAGQKMLTLLPEENDSWDSHSPIPSVHDGFFYALLQKRG